MPNIRVLPPADGKRPALVLNGRTYTCALNGYLDIPDFDAQIAAANGWTIVSSSVGPTSARPATPSQGAAYLDTTLAVTINFDGKVWRNPATGSAV